MALGLQNYTLGLFNQTHYYDFVQHRYDTLAALNSSETTFSLLENFNQTIAYMEFPRFWAPTQAYNEHKEFLEKNPDNTDQQKEERLALLKNGITPPALFYPKLLIHRRVSQLRLQTASSSLGDEGSVLSGTRSLILPNNRGTLRRAPYIPAAIQIRNQQNQEQFMIAVASCVLAFAILYSFAQTVAQALWGPNN